MDNFIVSARKYRPSTFSSVVGQETITATLKNAIRNNQVAQAFLFCGPRGVGKTTCARIFAKALNCTESYCPYSSVRIQIRLSAGSNRNLYQDQALYP